MTISSEILEILIHEIIQDDQVKVHSDTDLLTSGLLNSMALVRLVSAIESKYNFKIPPTDLVIENFLNIQSMETYVRKRLDNQ